MKILIIGGTGHVGRFLTPMLVEQGAEVVVVSRGKTAVPDAPAWRKVRLLRAAYLRGDSTWHEFVSAQAPDAIIDMLGTDVPGTYSAAKSSCRHYIACGSVWMFGPPTVVATPETTQGPCEFDGYARRYRELLDTQVAAKRDGLGFTAVMPPNICGPGKIPLDGSGGRSIEAHKAHSRGQSVKLPDGCNTLISPCDAEDIARGFHLAVSNREAAAGQTFNVGSAYALTAPQFIRAYGEIYGCQIPITWVTHREFYEQVLPDAGAHYHFREHMAPDISKIRRLLGYRPAYTPEQTMARAVEWMRRERLL